MVYTVKPTLILWLKIVFHIKAEPLTDFQKKTFITGCAVRIAEYNINLQEVYFVSNWNTVYLHLLRNFSKNSVVTLHSSYSDISQCHCISGMIQVDQDSRGTALV
jgi:hypothetical protein